MNHSVAKLWAEALESGEFKQGRGKLCTEANDGTLEHCCLGVLCVLASRNGVKVSVQRGVSVCGIGYKGLSFDGDATLLPPSVMDWAGLTLRDPILFIPVTDCPKPATVCNDEYQMDFKQIAAAIRHTISPEKSGA